MPVNQIPAAFSSRIELLRITCILCVVCVHIPSPVDVGQDFSSDAVRFFYNFLNYALFRSATPTLSVISGYLLFMAFDLHQYPAILRKKFRTLLMPALLWGTGMTLLLFAAQRTGYIERHIFDLVGGGPLAFADAILGLSHLPFNGPLYFLYDLFSCIVISPILYFILRTMPWAGLGLFVAIWLSGISDFLWIRGDILVGFYIGGVLAIRHIDLSLSARRAAIAVAIFVFLCLAVAWHASQGPQQMIEKTIDLELNLLRVFAPVAMWSYASLVTELPLANRLAQFGSISLFIFCCHEPLIRLLGRVYFSMMGKDAPAYYPAFYITAPIAVILFAICAKKTLQWLSPQALALLSGGRLGETDRSVRRRTTSVFQVLNE
jgi:succinoglycan biosynthesis protein ExoH